MDYRRTKMKFEELKLIPEIQDAIREMGYIDLTPIQEQTLPHILEGRDLLGQAETGSGKTAACALPMIQMVDPTQNAIQALIIVPTRELALQYVGEIAKIAKYTQVAPFAIYGGYSMEIQKAKLDHGVHILVATPGRLIDFLYNTPLTLSNVRTLVLDEADEMLKMGFIDDIRFIVSCIVHEHQTLLFSATMPEKVAQLASQFLKDPVHIKLNRDQVAPQSLIHTFRYVEPRDRLRTLMSYLDNGDVRQAIIFCNSRHGGEKLMDSLRKEYRSIEFIHGGLEQSTRTSIFRRFRNKDIQLMIATDIAGRGLDFSHVSHVINYDFPLFKENYTHRTGRAGRMGREGVALSLVTHRDLRTLESVVRSNKIEPVWIGEAPNLGQGQSRSSSSRRGRSRSGNSRRGRRPARRAASKTV